MEPTLYARLTRDIGEIALMPGDSARVELFTKEFD